MIHYSNHFQKVDAMNSVTETQLCCTNKKENPTFSASANTTAVQPLSVSKKASKEKNAKKSFDRAVSKTGACNFVPTNVKRQKLKFIVDIFTTLLEVRWRWTLLAFLVVYFGTWLGFAVLWYLILWFHGDIEHYDEEDWQPCVTGIQNFTSAFLFSVETQHTTGYGFYELKERCSTAVILFCAQSIVGTILEGVMVGLVFVKISRAKRRSATIMFSKTAVICLRDGILTFMFRVADMRRTHLLEAQVRAQVVKKRSTVEGEVIPDHREELEVGGDGEMDNKVLLFWPTNVIHKITETSPLYGLTAEDLMDDSAFEIIVVLDGIVESTGLNVQVRSSYLPSEILWGQRFQSLRSCKTDAGYRTIDYSIFHDTIPVNMSITNEDHV